ncbi:MAG TPA: superoxide dismutase [Novosphingobium sp.]
MSLKLIALPYPADALAPVISRQTLELHHGAHHKAYIDKTNEAIKGTPLADADLNTIVKQAAIRRDAALFDNAAQAWNHGFYWNSLTPDGARPDAALAKAIERDFGSLENLGKKIEETAVRHFGSGWAWLVARGDSLAVLSTHDAETPLTGNDNPLLTIDVWEHAYYLDVQNRRPEYVKGVVAKRLNWAFASENFARAEAWVYPG